MNISIIDQVMTMDDLGTLRQSSLGMFPLTHPLFLEGITWLHSHSSPVV